MFKGSKPSPKPVTTGKDYRSVSITPGIKCCLAAKSSKGKHFLMRDAPRLPLLDCTMPTGCSCAFKKSSDRRDGEDDRRQIGISETGRWFAGQENRTTQRNRRSGKE
jgi:hypothetical protein